MYKFLGNTGISMYDLLNVLAVFMFFIYNYSNFKVKRNFLSNLTNCFMRRCSFRNRKLTSKINFWVAVEILIISTVQYLPASILNNAFGSLVGTGSNYFGLLFFIPFVLLLLFYIISINPFKQLDLITPAFPLALIFVKLGCFCLGCCRGFDCSWGLYFPSKDITCFPTQLVEVALALLIFIFLLKYKEKAKEGTLFPIYLIVYSGTRFFSEFTSNRYTIIGIFNEYHIICFIGVIVGLLELFIVNKYAERIKPYFDSGFIWNDGKKKGFKRVKNKR